MRVGLVMGGGGFLGAAWTSAALELLEEETGWSPTRADHIVGTSAGSLLATGVAAGIPIRFISAYSAGLPVDGLADEDLVAAAAADRAAGTTLRLQRGFPRLGPGSPRLILSTVTRRSQVSALAAISGLLPRGLLSVDPVRDVIRRFAPRGWEHHPGLRVVACDYATGRRVVFGRERAAVAELPDAVAASCAIPGVYHPVTIDGRPYVDGGIWSGSNLDVVSAAGVDAVICLTPASVAEKLPGRTTAERMTRALRAASRRRLYEEASRVESRGVEVLLLQPMAEDAAAMGLNPLRRDRRAAVREAARHGVLRQLRARTAQRFLRRIDAPALRRDGVRLRRRAGAGARRRDRGAATSTPRPRRGTELHGPSIAEAA